nr:MAG TPA: hypothetical protein [Caudoviricetes sp.]
MIFCYQESIRFILIKYSAICINYWLTKYTL